MPRPSPSRTPRPIDETIRRAVDGDRGAQRALLERYGPMVYGLCRATDPEPDDCYQEIWEKALRALPRFDPGGPARLSTWLYRLAHHHLVDRQRKQRVRAITEPLQGEPGIDAGLDRTVLRAQHTRHLQAALTHLPAPQRRAVVFHYIEELTVTEVAQREGVPIGTIKSRLHQGRARLLALLRRSR